MNDARAFALAGKQHNRVSRSQLLELGASDKLIAHRVARGMLVAVEQGVFAFAPVLDDPWGRRMGATLTAPNTVLFRVSAACAYNVLDREGRLVTVVRPGGGGPVRHGGLWVHRSSTLDGECTVENGVPITTMERTLLDLSCCVSSKALARALRESIRLKHTTLLALGDWLGQVQHRRGSTRVALAMARYSGLPIERARSGAEIRALEVLRDAGLSMPRLNWDVAGEESDLSWPGERLIIEIDGGPFHLDRGEDARKEAAWREAGWNVKRLPSDDVYDRSHTLVALANGGLRVAR